MRTEVVAATGFVQLEVSDFIDFIVYMPCPELVVKTVFCVLHWGDKFTPPVPPWKLTKVDSIQKKCT